MTTLRTRRLCGKAMLKEVRSVYKNYGKLMSAWPWIVQPPISKRTFSFSVL